MRYANLILYHYTYLSVGTITQISFNMHHLVPLCTWTKFEFMNLATMTYTTLHPPPQNITIMSYCYT